MTTKEKKISVEIIEKRKLTKKNGVPCSKNKKNSKMTKNGTPTLDEGLASHDNKREKNIS
jgi:hypothetical protein